jgi:nucleotide-binding universal stress UspA family protein
MALHAEPVAAPAVEPLLACNILVAVDGSRGAELALAHAAAIARVAGGRLTLLTVVPPPRLPSAAPALGYDPHAADEGWAEELRIAAERAPRDVPVTLRLAHGNPIKEIVRQAEEGCHDLVVLGCEGRGPLHGALCGISQRVLRRSSVPVLVVRMPKP